MADTKVTNETNLEPLNGAEEVYVVRGGTVDGKASTEAIAQTVFYDLASVDPQVANRPWIDDGHLAVSGAPAHTPAGSFAFNSAAFVDGHRATYTLTVVGQPVDGDTITVGSKTYTFQTVLTDVDGNIEIGADITATADHIMRAVTVGGIGVAPSTLVNPAISASGQTTNNNGTITFKAVPGVAGNTLTISATFPISVSNDGLGADTVIGIHPGWIMNNFGGISDRIAQTVVLPGQPGSHGWLIFVNRVGTLEASATFTTPDGLGSHVGIITTDAEGAILSYMDMRPGTYVWPGRIFREVIVGGAAGTFTLPNGAGTISSGDELISVVQYVGAGVAVTDIVDITANCGFAGNALNVGINTTGSKLHVLYRSYYYAD